MKTLTILLSLLACGVAHAHANGSSFLRIASGDGGSPLSGTWDIATADLALPLELDANGDGALTAGEIDARRDAITRFALQRLVIGRGGENCRLSPGALTTRRRGPEEYVSFRWSGDCPSGGTVEVATSLFFGSVGYSALLDVRTTAGRYPAALSFNDPAWTEPAAVSIFATLLRFLREGVRHVLIGYDHVVFLLLLLLPSVLRGSASGWTMLESRRMVVLDLLKIVTAFTLAHSVTLALAASGAVTLPVRPVEVAIAASIVVAGLLNLIPAAAPLRLPLAFGFGCIHGFGFANALREIDAEGMRLLPLLFGFNVGVEVAQLLIVAATLPLLWLARRSSRYAKRVMPALSVSAAMIGAFWLAGRL
ncbi:MAG: HupE/UreJ family protein [Steroidobacteraceae bacterium]